MKPLPFEVAVEVQPWRDVGLRVRWQDSDYGGGCVIADRAGARRRFTAAQRAAVGDALVEIPGHDLAALDRTGRFLGGTRTDWIWILNGVAQDVNLGYAAKRDGPLGRELLRVGGGVATIHEYLTGLSETALRRYVVWSLWSSLR